MVWEKSVTVRKKTVHFYSIGAATFQEIMGKHDNAIFMSF
ncbi:hypothetical protein NBRC111894_4293 [Sporolactobacillus inulinus]|uniref:Uncharacterized protein n=1 Tax=Sporolactobacillus inulinus TaxID=2078 RepID=A0A4Y1ZI84_9BACL|nr:hypothetical protein NBRC111894_4293 [Sporolactobacillus inulinus]